jgi:hypothetical protein
MLVRAVLVVLVASFISARASAQDRYVIAVVSNAGSVIDNGCAVRHDEFPMEGKSRLDALQMIVVNTRNELTDAPVALVAALPRTKGALISLPARSQMGREYMSNDALDGATVIVRREKTDAPVCVVYLARDEKARLPRAIDPGTVADAEIKSAFADWDRLARLRLGHLGLLDHYVDSGAFSSRYTLYLLPSGRLAFPITRQISERDMVTLRQFVPLGATPTLTETFCAAPVFDRVLGTVPGALEGASPLGVARAEAQLVRATVVDSAIADVPLPLTASCADSLRVQSELTIPYVRDGIRRFVSSSTVTAIPTETTYLFVWGGGYGFSGAHPERIALADRPNVTGSANEKYLVSSSTASGPGSFATIGFRPCGLRARSATTWLRDGSFGFLCALISPTLVIPLQNRSPNEIGLAIPLLSVYGSELLIGVTAGQTEVLRDDINGSLGTDTSKAIGIGRTYSLPGDPPVRRIWTGRGVGLFLGLSTYIASVRDYFAGKKPATKTGTSRQTVGDSTKTAPPP